MSTEEIMSNESPDTNQNNMNNEINPEFVNFKEELDKLFTLSGQTNDWKDLKKNLSEQKDKIKNQNFNSDEISSLNEIISQIFDNITRIQNEEFQKLEEEFQRNYDSVINIVSEACNFADTSDDYKQSRDKLLQAQESFKNLTLKRSHKDELYKKIQTAFDNVARKQNEERENYEMECIENFHNLKNKIEAAISFAQKSEIFAEARKALINVQNQIKGLKLIREQRDSLYQIIRDAFDDVNKRQEEERSSYDSVTAANFETLSKVVNDAVEFAKTSEEFSLSRERLIDAQNQIKSAKLKKEHRDKLYGDIRVVFEVINQKQSEERTEYDAECNTNYEKLTEKVNDAFALVHGLTEFNLIRESLITVQGEVKIAKLKKEQRNELFSRIREAFTIFDKKKNEYFEQRKEDKSKKLKDIQDNLKEKIQRLQDVLDKDIESLNIQKQKLEEPGIDEFMVSEINSKIENIQSRINEKQTTIDQSNVRIAEIDLEISKL